MTEVEPVVGELERTETGRICGHCQLCCKILPIYDLLDRQGNPKPWNTKCQHQRKGNHGCKVYHTARPASCRAWSCAWLSVAGTEDLPRPDKCHYIVDTYVTSFELSEYGFMQAVQIWLDPGYPEAWRCTKLLTFLVRMAEQHGFAANIRLRDKDDSLLLFPPAIEPVIGDWTKLDTRQGLANIKLERVVFPNMRT